MRRIGDALERFLRFAGGALLVALLVPVAIQVFARLVPGLESPMWTEEAARYLLVWTIMVGAVVALRRGSHFVVDLLPPLPARIDRWIARTPRTTVRREPARPGVIDPITETPLPPMPSVPTLRGMPAPPAAIAK
jgi:branched-subunit amino acid transport protein